MPRRRPTRRLAATALVLAAASAGACSRDEPAPTAEPSPARPGPASARWDVVDVLREDEALAHDASDGGGRAWLVRRPDDPPAATAGAPGRFHLVYEVGEHGVAVGGSVQLQVSPFWGWSTPQTREPLAPGYTTIATDAEGVTLHPATLDAQLLGLDVAGRALEPGERIEIVYGAGEAGAIADRYAERGSAFWFAVDGDGDGTRAFVPDPPTIDVLAGPPAALSLRGPTVARPGEALRLAAAVLDANANTGVDLRGDVVLVDPPDGLDLPARVAFGDGGRAEITGVAREPGVYRLEAALELADGRRLVAQANPIVVTREGPRVLWADLHGHSGLSDGTGVPEDYFVYARDVAALDVVALTDHDHWGVLPLVDTPAHWQEIRERTLAFHAPGAFVTLLGFEWTNWIHGHRHVLYFGDDGPVVDSLAPETDAPGELWAALEGLPALTIAHHPAGGPVATNWDVAPDPRFEPVTEVVSVHGSSEAPDSPAPIYDAQDGHWVRDALDRGYRLGFVGSGDTHDGHPGSYRAGAAAGGLAAILSEERTRGGVEGALRARRSYATNGARILLRVALGGRGMGGVLPLAAGERSTEPLFVQVIAEAPLDRVELVRSGELVDGLRLEGRLDATLERDVPDLEAGEYVYVRVVQEDGGAAWSSPIFVGEQSALDEVGEAALEAAEEVQPGPADDDDGADRDAELGDGR